MSNTPCQLSHAEIEKWNEKKRRERKQKKPLALSSVERLSRYSSRRKVRHSGERESVRTSL